MEDEEVGYYGDEMDMQDDEDYEGPIDDGPISD